MVNRSYMKHSNIEKSELKLKSEELKIAFPNLLAGYVLEELMYLITDSLFGETLLLKNNEIFGVEQYRNKNVLTLEFAYLLDEKVIGSGEFVPGQELSLKLGYIMLASILKKEKVPNIKWRGRVLFSGDTMEMEITGELEEMTVPLRICINPILTENLMLQKKVLHPFMEEQEEIEYFQYPWEMMLSENLYNIIKDMELIPEMRAFDIVYRILDRELINGRHIHEFIYFYCKRDGMDVDEDRLKEILSYQNYTYMKKRWDKYARQQKKPMPSWEEVMKKIKNFLSPIWEALCKDEIYCGDWMPELGRFLM